MKKLLFIFPLLFIGLIAIHQYKFSVIPLWKVPKLLSSMRAKEFCTCYFLIQKGEDYCLESVLKGYPKFKYLMDNTDQTVTFENPFARSRAKVVSKRLGCQLIK